MLGRTELIKLVEKIMQGEYASEEEEDRDVVYLRENTVDPYAMDYIFQKRYEGLTAEQIADKILEYRPIAL